MNDLVSEYQQYQDATAAKRVSSTRRKVSTTWSRRRPNRQSRSRLDSSSFSAEFKHVRGRRPAILAFSRGSWVDDLPCNSNPCALERGRKCLLLLHDRGTSRLLEKRFRNAFQSSFCEFLQTLPLGCALSSVFLLFSDKCSKHNNRVSP